ncbi:MAG: NAD(P)/FAD-dependent oxidoreductase [Gammaproteobacteria bacterium]
MVVDKVPGTQGVSSSLGATDSDDAGLVIVGASHCGVQCAFAARRGGFEERIVLIGDDPEIPYHRPPLSKDILTGAKTVDQVSLKPDSAYIRSKIELRAGVRVTRIDRERKVVVTDNAGEFAYSSLILATGASPRTLQIEGSDLDNIHYLRSLGDACEIRPLDGSLAVNAVVVGGGYIGLEVAASLRKLGARVTVVEATERLLQRVAGPALSSFFTRIHQEEGVDVITGAQVTGFQGEGAVSHVVLKDGRVLDADLVVVGIGVIPETELAEEAGLPVENGVLVDGRARTEDPLIYAAGDCARGYNALYQRHLRLESVQNANDQGKVAVQNILGIDSNYGALPWFWSDQYDVKLQIAGLTDGADTLVVRGDPTTGRSFSLCYVRDDVLVAVEAVNRPRDFLSAKSHIIASARMDLLKLQDEDCAIADCIVTE